ncbi:MAG: HNH endonuclease [Candidatus Nanopelagicales bacterium]
MPTAHADAVMQAVNTLAKDARFEVADGCITRGQRRVAALVALTLGDPGSVAVVDGPVQEAKLAVHVNVLVPLETLVGSDACGRIGHTPCTAEEIRDLIADAALGSSTIRRLVTDSAGCILDAGRRHYLASDLQKLVIRLRDQQCRFPGCNRPAERCEIDHAKPYDAGGLTDTCNLGPLCKHHHEMKTAGYWHITASARNGSCTWRSPLGRIYEHEPPDLVPPPPPHDPPPF